MNFPQDIVAFINTENWTYAKTMPEWPHEYLVKMSVDTELFIKLVGYIRINGYQGKFYEKDITYYDEDGYTYWTMGAPVEETTIINRCLKENTYEYRSVNKTLPEDH